MMARRVIAGRSGFSPKALFANGEQGVWYDPSDFSTLFQDAAGTTPVTAVEQPVGLMLDKSKGLGPELVTNGDFSNGTTGWTTYNSTFSVSSGVLTVTSTSPQFGLRQQISVTAGKWYVVEFDIDYTNVSGTSRNSFNIGNTGFIPFGAYGTFMTLTGNGRKKFYILSTVTNSAFNFYIHSMPATSGSFLIDSISVRELPGNHAYQSTSANRPTLSARYNLLTKTEQFDDSYWYKGRCTVTANDQTAPDGTLTGDKFNCTATSTNGFYFENSVTTLVTIRSGLVIKCSLYAKKGSRNQVRAVAYDSGSNGVVVSFDLNSVSYVTSATFGSGWSVVGTPTATQAANGWVLLEFNVQTAGTVASLSVSPSVTSISDSSCTSGVDYGYAWGASIVPANQSSLPYQRVNTSTDYDADPKKFPPYLKFDGTDDSLVTNSIDFTATDKMTVWAGARKYADTDFGVIAELTSDSDTTNGGFYLGAAVSNGIDRKSWALQTRGTVARQTSHARTYAAPITSVISSALDNGGATDVLQIAIRINGGDPGSYWRGNGPTSAGNYANAALYLGARGGSSLYFNGHLYSLIVRGAQSSANLITATERYVARKTGVTL